jgi:HK97 family phage major capsid protein
MSNSAGRLATRYLKAIAATDNNLAAESFAEAMRWAEGDRVKAAVSAYTTNNAAALLPVGASFMAAVAPRTIVGRLMDRLRVLPARTPVVRQTGGATATWVKEGDAIAVQAGTFVRDPQLHLLKVAAISVLTKELSQAWDGEDLITRDLQRACAEALDAAFADPGNAGVAEESPASVFYGAPSVPSSGPTASDFRADFVALMNAFEGNLDTAALITDTTTALQLALIPDLVGDSLITVTGESRLVGMPMYFSTSVPRDSGGGFLGLLDLDRTDVVGLTQAELSVSREAAIQMDSAPTMSSTVPTATQVVSLFQVNSTGLLAAVYANWRTAPGAAAYISGVDYTGA